METNQIAFKVGDRIAIISKSRGNRGWWKGKIDDKVSGCVCAYIYTVQSFSLSFACLLI